MRGSKGKKGKRGAIGREDGFGDALPLSEEMVQN